MAGFKKPQTLQINPGSVYNKYVAEFRYECIAYGKRQRGTISADSREVATLLLKKKGWIPTSITEIIPKEPQDAPGFGGVSVQRLAAYTRKFATLVKTDIPITQVLSLLSESEQGRLLPEASQHVANQIANGVPFGQAMAERPKVFSKLYIRMVEAGLNSGTLDLVAENLAQLYENESKLRLKILGKLIYPFTLLGFSFLISLLLRAIGTITAELFAVLMGFWFIFGVIVLIGMTPPGYKVYREIGFKIPGLGKLMRTINLARFCRIFSLQFKAGVSILQGLDVSKEILQDRSFRDAVDRMQAHIMDGMDLRDAMVASGIFPSQMSGMIGAGEVAGSIEIMLDKLAEYYEQDIDSMSSVMVNFIYFAVYFMIMITAAIIVISAWGSYFGMIEGLINEV